jgi:hypothetical protein
VKAPPIESTREFIQGNIRDNIPQFVVLDGERVVGWCDISSMRGESFFSLWHFRYGSLEGIQKTGNRYKING